MKTARARKHSTPPLHLFDEVFVEIVGVIKGDFYPSGGLYKGFCAMSEKDSHEKPSPFDGLD